MNIYTELINVFTNLIFGSENAFNDVVVTTPIITQNRLNDIINAIIVNLPKLCTLLVIVLMFVCVISLFYFVFILFKQTPNETPSYTRKKGHKRK